MKSTLAVSMLLFATVAHAEHARVFSETRYSSDSDQQTQWQFAAGYRQELPSIGANSQWSAQIIQRVLSAPAGQELFTGGRLQLRADLAPEVGIDLSVDALAGGSWSPLLGSTRAHWRPLKAWYFEASAERELVDTVVAVRNRTLIDTAAASVDWTPWPWLTMVGGLSRSLFTDGNERNARTLRVVATPPSWPWVNAQLRVKRADSAGIGVGYFNPRRLEEIELLARLAGAPFGDRWVLSLLAGAGRQYIERGSGSPTWSLDARARGWFSDTYGLESSLACTNTRVQDSAAARGGYRYCSGRLSLIMAW